MPDHRALARDYVAGTRHDGWEPHDVVARRFDAAVARHAAIAARTGRALVIGTHGMASVVWLSRRVPLCPDPAAFWAALRFPDVIDVDLAARTASRRASHHLPPTMA